MSMFNLNSNPLTQELRRQIPRRDRRRRASRGRRRLETLSQGDRDVICRRFNLSVPEDLRNLPVNRLRGIARHAGISMEYRRGEDQLDQLRDAICERMGWGYLEPPDADDVPDPVSPYQVGVDWGRHEVTVVADIETQASPEYREQIQAAIQQSVSDRVMMQAEQSFRNDLTTNTEEVLRVPQPSSGNVSEFEVRDFCLGTMELPQDEVDNLLRRVAIDTVTRAARHYITLARRYNAMIRNARGSIHRNIHGVEIRATSNSGPRLVLPPRRSAGYIGFQLNRMTNWERFDFFRTLCAFYNLGENGGSDDPTVGSMTPQEVERVTTESISSGITAYPYVVNLLGLQVESYRSLLDSFGERTVCQACQDFNVLALQYNNYVARGEERGERWNRQSGCVMRFDAMGQPQICIPAVTQGEWHTLDCNGDDAERYDILRLLCQNEERRAMRRNGEGPRNEYELEKVAGACEFEPMREEKPKKVTAKLGRRRVRLRHLEEKDSKSNDEK